MRILLLLLLLASCQNQKPQLHLYSWAEVLDPEIIRSFEEECQCRVVIDTFDTNETLYAKIRTGASGYDLIFPSYYFVQVMMKQDLLAPVDRAAIPNLRYLDAQAVAPIDKKVLDFSVPFFLSFTGLGYHKDRLPNFIPTWQIFGDRTLRGRMTLLNDLREVLGAALITLGYSPNTRSEAEINAAVDLVLKWKKNIAKFENEQYKNGIATAEFLVVQGFSGEIRQVHEENPNIVFALPKEGAIISYDLIAIPKGAKQKDLAHAFINHLYKPEVAAKNMAKILEQMPNTEAYKLLSKDLRTLLFPTPEEMARAHPVEDLGDDILLYRKAWERVKE